MIDFLKNKYSLGMNIVSILLYHLSMNTSANSALHNKSLSNYNPFYFYADPGFWSSIFFHVNLNP